MHGLGAREPESGPAGAIARPEPVVLVLAEGAVHLSQDDRHVSLFVQEIKKRDWVEAVAQIAEIRQQHHRPNRERNALGFRRRSKPFAQRNTRIPEMITIFEACPVESVIPGKNRPRHGLRNPVNVKHCHKDRILKLVRTRPEAAVPEGAAIDSRLGDRYHLTPIWSATLTAERRPSSWNP